MSGESDSVFVQSVQDLLEAGNTVGAKAVFCAAEHTEKVKNSSWDLIPCMTKFLSKENYGNNLDIFNCSKELLISIADLSNPEEALLQFIEEVEEADSDLKFIVLLEPLKKVLLRIPKKLLISLAWGFNSINCYLNRYEIPNSENLHGKEKLLLDNTKESQSINELYKSVLHFYELLIQGIAFRNEETNEISSIKLKFLMRLLGKPLVYLDVEMFDGIKSRARLSSEYLVEKILQICSDPISLLKHQSMTENDDPLKLNDLGLASYYYLLFSEHIFIEKVPKVYDSTYFFQSSLYLTIVLLKDDHQIVVEKGLKLAGSLIQHVRHSKLTYLLLDSSHHEDFCKTLANLIVYNESESFRKFGLQIYQSYLSCFEIRGFYLIIYNLIPELTHSGLKGYTITLYKDLVAKDFGNAENVFIRGQKLLALIRKFCFLQKKEESDLVELSDEIIATLNLLRYLTIRDKLNTTQIWDYIPVLDEIYFQPIRKGLELSRAHYKLKIRELQEEKAVKGTYNDISVSVKGEHLSGLGKNGKIDVLNKSLTVFDVIDSLLSRLLECVESQGR